MEKTEMDEFKENVKELEKMIIQLKEVGSNTAILRLIAIVRDYLKDKAISN